MLLVHIQITPNEGTKQMTTTEKTNKILAAIAARGWFTAELFINEAHALRDAGIIKLGTAYSVGGNRKTVWEAA
jgi:hypothetical protein